MHPGTIFEYKEENRLYLACILEERKGKMLGINEAGKSISLSPSRIMNIPGLEVSSTLSNSEIVRTLQNFVPKVEEIAKTIDLKELWELVYSDASEMSLQEIIELLFPSPTPQERSSVFRALERDSIFFKRKGEIYISKPKDQVEATIKQLDQAKKKEEERREFIQWLNHLFSEGLEGDADKWKDFLENVKNFALVGYNFKKAKEISEILKEVYSLAKEGLDPQELAFEIMVRLGTWNADEDLSILKKEISKEFSSQALEESRKILGYKFTPGEERENLEFLYTFSVDEITTRDIDDALSLEYQDGHFILGIHIADVSHFIQPGTVLDKEALGRGATVYLPQGKISMFPLDLSEEKMSLKEGEERPAFSLIFKLDEGFNILKEEIRFTYIRLKKNYTYDQLDSGIDLPPEVKEILPILEMFANKRREERLKQGAVIIESSEIKVEIDEGGMIRLKKIEKTSKSRRLIEELMILANEMAAFFCLGEDIPAIYRKQAHPREPLPNNREFPRPELRNYELRRRMPKWEISTLPGEHFALGLKAYTQVTSPIRRYQDLIMQRQIKHYIQHKTPLYTEEEIVKGAANAEITYSVVSSVEKESIQYWLLKYLSLMEGKEVTGIVLRKEGNHYLAELKETLLPISFFASSPVSIGDEATLRIEEVRPRKGLIRLRHMGHKD